MLFVGAEDWMFVSRHLPLVRAARELGLDPLVVARGHAHRAAIEQAGARFLAADWPRPGRSPAALWHEIEALKRIMLSRRPSIVQLQGVRTAVSGLAAARLAGASCSVVALGGLGQAAVRPGLQGDATRAGLRTAIAAAMKSGPVHVTFDNPDDPRLLGLDPANARQVHVMPGQGVDPLVHMPEAMPWAPPLKLVFGSPLLWANGPDLAVQAVGKARGEGVDVSLSLIGAAHSPGKRAVPAETLRAWSRLPGIIWYGPTPDIAQVWRQHHALVLPSRGGDGLPPILVQAASAGRPAITTDVGGCGSFVRDGVDGCVVPAEDVAGLADAIMLMARAPALVERMGQAGRGKVLDGYTERKVMEAYKALWRQMLRVDSAA